MGLAIYNEKKMALGPVDFLNDVLHHVHVADMNSHERTKQFGIAFTAIAESMRITNPIDAFDKSDIKDLILTRFKRLSINEIYYAFKLERYVSYGEPTKHYNRFNAQYVATVLEKYVLWKIDTRQKHNLSIAKEEEEKSVSEEEKQYWINRGVTSCLEHFIEHRSILDGKAYIYDILYELDYLPKDVEYKKRVHADAVEALKFEYENKKAKSTLDKKDIKLTLNEITNHGNEKVKIRCYNIALREFFQKLTSDEEKLEAFKKRFENKKEIHNG